MRRESLQARDNTAADDQMQHNQETNAKCTKTRTTSVHICNNRLYAQFKADTHYLYIRPVYTGAFLTPVHMARMYGCQKMHPYIYGP